MRATIMKGTPCTKQKILGSKTLSAVNSVPDKIDVITTGPRCIQFTSGKSLQRVV